MRISDWSSDVCSSVLSIASAWLQVSPPSLLYDTILLLGLPSLWPVTIIRRPSSNSTTEPYLNPSPSTAGLNCQDAPSSSEKATRTVLSSTVNGITSLPAWVPEVSAMPWEGRSEEHTSELQSLMRISYAVFCLKKKKTYK